MKARRLLWLLFPLAVIWLGSWIYFSVIPFGWWTAPAAVTWLLAVVLAGAYAVKRIAIDD
jgi:hypothetical protein